jgi:hypothetical protein
LPSEHAKLADEAFIFGETNITAVGLCDGNFVGYTSLADDRGPTTHVIWLVRKTEPLLGKKFVLGLSPSFDYGRMVAKMMVACHCLDPYLIERLMAHMQKDFNSRFAAMAERHEKALTAKEITIEAVRDELELLRNRSAEVLISKMSTSDLNLLALCGEQFQSKLTEFENETE